VVLPAESGLPNPQPPGKVALSVQESLNSRIEMMDPDGSNRTVIQKADALKTCPALSPDGSRLAYLSNRTRAYPYLSNVYIHDLSNPDTPDRRLRLPNLENAGYECPVWSPDGTSLAMVGHLFGLSYLAIFSMEVKVDAVGTPSPEAQPTVGPEDGLLETGVYLTIETPSAGLQPAWTPDSRSVYLAFPRRMGFPPVVYLYHWHGPSQDISSPGAVLTFSAGWEDILGLSISPDGRTIALLVERSLESSSETEQLSYAVLHIYNRSTMKLLNELDLYSYHPDVSSPRFRLIWQADGQVVFSYPTDRFFSRAVSFIRFDPRLDALQVVAASPDMLYDWTMIGDWLLFASESGLWGSTMPDLSSPSVRPRWLSGDVILDLTNIGN
jgi:Tol biopolymer transport system component